MESNKLFFSGVNVDVLEWAPRFRQQLANIDFNSNHT